jgi:hypothetical protein
MLNFYAGKGDPIGPVTFFLCLPAPTLPLHCKKGKRFIPARVSLVSDIPAGDGKIANLFYYSVAHSFSAVTYQSVGTWVHSTLHFVISWKSLVAFANHCPFTVVHLSGPQCSQGGLIENIQQDILPPVPVGYNRLVYSLWNIVYFFSYTYLLPISSPIYGLFFCRNK